MTTISRVIAALFYFLHATSAVSDAFVQTGATDQGAVNVWEQTVGLEEKETIVTTEDHWTVCWDLTGSDKEQFDQVGISIPFPQRDVRLFQNSNQDSAT